MRRTTVVLPLLLAALLVAGCGDDDADGPDGSGGSASPGTETIEITFEGDTVTPNGERVAVDAGQPIEIVVKADAAGELHVHSTPEQELAYGTGTTTLKLTLDEPGVVDVESHELEVVIVQLEVS